MAYPMPQKNVNPAQPESSMNAGSSKASAPRSGGWAKGLVTLIAILVIIAGGLYLIKDKGLGLSSGLKGEWQAVFLTNGQVYFGKVQNASSDVVRLKDIYYLQVVDQPLQQTQQGEEAAQPTGESEQRLTLIKLGNELHGPEDEMVINRFHVVLMEDLKDDSRVVQAINDYVASQAQ